MASIRKKSGKFQAQIRRKGMPSVTATFSKRKDAVAFANKVASNTELHRKLGRATSIIPTFRDLRCARYSKTNIR